MLHSRTCRIGDADVFCELRLHKTRSLCTREYKPSTASLEQFAFCAGHSFVVRYNVFVLAGKILLAGLGGYQHGFADIRLAGLGFSQLQTAKQMIAISWGRCIGLAAQEQVHLHPFLRLQVQASAHGRTVSGTWRQCVYQGLSISVVHALVSQTATLYTYICNTTTETQIYQRMRAH